MNADELRATVTSLPALQTEGFPASERTWRGHVNAIRELIITEGPATFLTWPPIVSTMAAIGHHDWSQIHMEYLRRLPDWESRWFKAVTEIPVGSPTIHCDFPASSNALLGAAYSIAQLEQRLDMRVSGLSFVFEFGGGYGCMARLLRELGFEGLYLDYDFPVIAALAEYYLSEAGGLTSKGSCAFCISDLGDIRWILDADPVPADSLFLSTWALSEAPLDTRMEVLSLVDKFRYFYVVYQPSFREVNNDRFFASVPDMLQGWQWESWKVEHLGARALAGVRTS